MVSQLKRLTTAGLKVHAMQKQVLTTEGLYFISIILNALKKLKPSGNMKVTSSFTTEELSAIVAALLVINTSGTFECDIIKRLVNEKSGTTIEQLTEKLKQVS